MQNFIPSTFKIVILISLTLQINLSFAQVYNDNIKFQVVATDYCSTANEDDNPNYDDISIKTRVYNIAFDGSIIIGYDDCYTWDCHAPCYQTGLERDISTTLGGAGSSGIPMVGIKMEGWEDDGGEICDYDDGDDAHTLTDIAIIDLIDTAPDKWRDMGWFSSYFPSIPTFYHDVKFKLRWTYQCGDSEESPLRTYWPTQFPRHTLEHINSNRNEVNVIYDSWEPSDHVFTNDQPSTNIYYHFALYYPLKITISTNHPETNFDTYLHLFEAEQEVGYSYTIGEPLESNDNIGESNASEIVRYLCPGDYIIVVEGKDHLTGDFKLTITKDYDYSPYGGFIWPFVYRICEGEPLTSIDNVFSSNFASEIEGNLSYS